MKAEVFLFSIGTQFFEMEDVPMIFREGTHILLRLLEQTDAPDLSRWMNDAQITQFINIVRPMSQKEEEEWLEGLSKRKNDVILGIVVKKEQKLIGTIGLHNIDQLHGNAVTGTVIGEKEYHGKGYGTEAKMLLLEFAFNRLNLHAIRSDIFAFNGRSVAYGKKCGYEEVGRLPEWLCRNGKRHDHIMLVVRAERWRPLWEVYCADPDAFLNKK